MKIIVDIRNYTNFEYDEYFDGGSPDNNPYVVGQVVAIKEDNRSGKKGHWTLGVVLGVITQHEVRTDAHGMVPVEDIRPAVVTDFGKSNVSYVQRLYDELQGKAVLITHTHKTMGENRQDSLWFVGEDSHVATVRKNGRTLIVEATGEQRVYLDEKGKGDFESCIGYDGDRAKKVALKLEFTDEDLNNDQKTHFEANSWFAIREVDADGNISHDDRGICGKYDEAISLALEEIEKVPEEPEQKKFLIEADVQVKVWQKCKFTVLASSLDEAKRMIKKYPQTLCEDYKTLTDTEEVVQVDVDGDTFSAEEA